MKQSMINSIISHTSDLKSKVEILEKENEQLKICLQYESGPMMGEISIQGIWSAFDYVMDDSGFRVSLSCYIRCCIFEGRVDDFAQAMSLLTHIDLSNEYVVNAWNYIGKVLNDIEKVGRVVSEEEFYIVKEDCPTLIAYCEEELSDLDDDVDTKRVTLRDCAKMKIDTNGWTYSDYAEKGFRSIQEYLKD